MTVHLFCAVSSARCANFAMRRKVKYHKQDVSPDVANTVLKNVDHCLKSLSSSSAAVKHLAYLHKLMLMGGFKGATNDQEVVESIPQEERSKDVKAKSLILNAIRFP